MKLLCRPNILTGELKARFEQDSELVALTGYKAVDKNTGASKKWLPLKSPASARLLKFMQAEPGGSLSTEIRWSKKELEEAKGYLLSCSTVSMPDADYKHQLNLFNNSPTLKTPSKWGSIRIHPSLQLSTINLRQKTMRYLDEWTEELLLAEDLIENWPDSWSNKSYEAVQNRDGEARTDLFRISNLHVMPPVADNTLCHYETWDEGTARPSTPRFRRTLAYEPEVLDEMPLVARTAEPFGVLGQGLLVVSPEFRAWCLKHGWKGPKFHPLLSIGSDTWKQFEEHWSKFLRLAGKASDRIPG